MLLPDIYCLTCKQISFRNFLFDTVKQFLQCHFLSSFILPLLLWLQNWYLLFLFHGRNRENRKKSKTLERKNVASNYARISNAWVFPFPVEPRLDATHRLCIYIYMYKFRFSCFVTQNTSGEYLIFYFYEMIRGERFLTNRFLRLDDHAVFWTRIANAKAFRFIRLCRSIRGNRKRLILDATMMNRVYKNDAKSTCF